MLEMHIKITFIFRACLHKHFNNLFPVLPNDFFAALQLRHSHCYSNEGTLKSFLNPNYFESWSLITTEISLAVEAFNRKVKKYFCKHFPWLIFFLFYLRKLPLFSLPCLFCSFFLHAYSSLNNKGGIHTLAIIALAN